MPRTEHLFASNSADLDRAAQLLRDGGLVAFATETVYGLGANALDGDAVAKVFAAKQRPSWDPLIVHLADASMLPEVAVVPEGLGERVGKLADRFWPGPLTMLLPRRSTVPDSVTAGRPLVGIRIPAHDAALRLLRQAGVPVAAPSANRFGHISPTSAAHVFADLDGRIDAVLDAGPTTVGVESTVLDTTQTPMVVYRPGVVSAAELFEASGVPTKLFTTSDDDSADALQPLPSPGVGIRHYAPAVPLYLVEGTERELPGLLAAAAAASIEGCQRTGILLPEDWSAPAAADVAVWGSWHDFPSLARGLFAGLRSLEDAGVEAMFAPLPAPGGLRDAIRDRLLKAARPR